MTKKREILSVEEDLSGLKDSIFGLKPETIDAALKIIIKQMEVSGNRPRTILDYQLYVTKFQESTGLMYLQDINVGSIYMWLSSMNVSDQTRLTRLKCFKAFLSRCYDNGWLKVNFWKNVKVKVNSKIKEGAKESNINLLLSVLDFSDFVQLRDGTAALLMYKTGIRLNTLTLLENKHIDFTTNMLKLDGAIMKNHEQLLLPFDDVLHRLLTVLIKQNDKIRDEYKKTNKYVFITKGGDTVRNSLTNNNISKMLKKYAKKYEINNISPHDLRRGFAKNLYDKGASIAIISKALGHSNIAVTTQYLHLEKEEIVKDLRKHL